MVWKYIFLTMSYTLNLGLYNFDSSKTLSRDIINNNINNLWSLLGLYLHGSIQHVLSPSQTLSS